AAPVRIPVRIALPRTSRGAAGASSNSDPGASGPPSGAGVSPASAMDNRGATARTAIDRDAVRTPITTVGTGHSTAGISEIATAAAPVATAVRPTMSTPVNRAITIAAAAAAAAASIRFGGPGPSGTTSRPSTAASITTISADAVAVRGSRRCRYGRTAATAPTVSMAAGTVRP